MALAYECPDCRTAWPYAGSYKVCPECSIPCRSAATPRALTNGQAQTRLRRLEFLRYYEARERFRSGPSPEEVGRQEALEEVARVRALEEALAKEEARS